MGTSCAPVRAAEEEDAYRATAPAANRGEIKRCVRAVIEA
jgi:hypothetical protein